MIAVTANMEIIAAANRKISTAILSKNSFLGLLFCALSSILLFCLYFCTNPFRVPGALSNLLSKGVACNEIGRTCFCVVQFWFTSKLGNSNSSLKGI